MAEIIVKNAKLGWPQLSAESPGAEDHILALLLALAGAMAAAFAIRSPIAATGVFAGLFSIALNRLMRGGAWLLLVGLVVPAIGAGELGRFETSGGTLIAPSLLIVALWAVAFFSSFVSEKNQCLWRIPLVGAFVAFWLSIILSVTNSVSVLHWARGLLEAVLGFAFFAYPWLYLKNRKELRLCLRVLIWLAVLTVIFGVLQYSAFDAFDRLLPLLYAKKEIPFIEVWQAQGRMVANWVHPSDFGSLLNIAAPLALYLWLSDRKRRFAPLLAFLIIGVGIFLTATRTPIIAFCLSSVLLCFLMRAKKTGIAIMAAATTLLVGSLLFSLTSQRFKLSDEGNLATVEERRLLWLEAASFFVQHPVVGIGARNFMDRVVGDPDMPTHNVYLETAAETGIIGLLAFLYLLYRALRSDFGAAKVHLSQELQDLRFAFLCSSLAIMIESLTDNDFYVWQVWCLFWLIRGLSAVITAKPEKFMRTVAAAP